MAQQNINVGTAPNDGTGDTLKTSFTKCNGNFTELYNLLAPIIAAGGAWTTGDVKLTLKAVADSGWLMMDDLTIGSATAPAYHPDNATQPLFNLLFANVNDTWAPLVTSLGVATTRAAQGSAAAAWAANCCMYLPAALGRALAVAGAGSGLTSRPLGSIIGGETETQTTASMASHFHGLATYGGPPGIGAIAALAPWGHSGAYDSLGTYYGGSEGLNGSGTPSNIMQPTTFMNVMIKL